MKGIILAGGTGSRLHPMTLAVSKQLMPVYDKPLIYYPLTTLMSGGVRDILIITTPHDSEVFKAQLGDGSQWGISLTYAEQARPEGLAQALLIAAEFTAGEPTVLILGDNLFHGHGTGEMIQRALEKRDGASIFAAHVQDASRYGVVEFDASGMAVSLEEKPTSPRSNWAVTGLYVYDSEAAGIASMLKPSRRGELEITDLNQVYLDLGKLSVERLPSDYVWLDTGTPDSLVDAAVYVRTVEQRQGLKIACPEELAWREGWIASDQMLVLADRLRNSSYGQYLLKILSDPV